MNKCNITFGRHTREYQLVREKRTTMKLTVKPNLDIILACPIHATDEKIKIFLHKKWLWIDRQINFFSKYKKEIYKKEYVSGESFYYLGRQYQLIVKKSSEDKVTLLQGKFIVETTLGLEHKAYIKLLIDMWYKERAKSIFKQRFEILYQKFGFTKKILLRIVFMKRKWGSFKGATITLNPLLIQANKDAIDYVITHELCHVKYKNHNKKFWEFLEKMYPDWEKVKEKLELKFG